MVCTYINACPPLYISVVMRCSQEATDTCCPGSTLYIYIYIYIYSCAVVIMSQKFTFGGLESTVGIAMIKIDSGMRYYVYVNRACLSFFGVEDGCCRLWLKGRFGLLSGK
jgi:hypothetical protein